MIDNPEYKGEWAPRKIPNPEYFEDLTPVKSLEKIVSTDVPLLRVRSDLLVQGGVGIELWTMTEDILFDNLYVGHSLDDAKALAAETFDIKKPLEAAAAKPVKSVDDDDDELTFGEDPIGFIREKVLDFVDLLKLDPLLAFKTHPETGAALAVSTLTFLGMVGVLLGLIGSSQKPVVKVRFPCSASSPQVLTMFLVFKEDRCSFTRRQEGDRGCTRCACRW